MSGFKREREDNNDDNSNKYKLYDDDYDIGDGNDDDIDFGYHYRLLPKDNDNHDTYQIDYDIPAFYLFKTEMQKGNPGNFKKNDIILGPVPSGQDPQSEYIVYHSEKNNRLQIAPIQKTLDEEFPDPDVDEDYEPENKKSRRGGKKNKSKKQRKSKKGGKTRKSKKERKTRKNRK
jgi:hypothetical protein